MLYTCIQAAHSDARMSVIVIAAAACVPCSDLPALTHLQPCRWFIHHMRPVQVHLLAVGMSQVSRVLQAALPLITWWQVTPR